jgi:seryl-tRNA synthetase
MGTAVRYLKLQYRGQKLAEGKTIGGSGQLTDKVMNSLQNYYGDAIRRNKGDVRAMMKAVQANLLHYNSSNEHPQHHLCPEGPELWRTWQVARATGKDKEPLTDAIVQLQMYYTQFILTSVVNHSWRSVYTDTHKMQIRHSTQLYGSFALRNSLWVKTVYG